MGGQTFSSEDFTPGDDTYIYSPGDPMIMQLPELNFSVSSLSSNGPVTTSSGNDLIFGYGAFVLTPQIPDEVIEAVPSIEGTFIGLDVTAILDTQGERIGPGLKDRDETTDDDTVIGAANLLSPAQFANVNDVIGLRFGTGDSETEEFITTGIGNDIVAGAALAQGGGRTYGIFGEALSTGTGNDAVVGVSANFQSDGENASAFGLDVIGVSLGTGVNIVAGGGLAVMSGGGTGAAVGAKVKTLTAGDKAGLDLSPTFVVGVGGVVSDIDGELAEGVFTSTTAGVWFDAPFNEGDAQVNLGDGDDAVVGLVFYQLGANADVGAGLGIASVALSSVDLGDGDNIFAGVAYLELGPDSVAAKTGGIRVDELITGSGNDLVLGTVWVEFEGFGEGRELHGVQGDLFSNLNFDLGAGEDQLIGIGEAVSTAKFDAEAIGMVDVAAQMGDNNDIVIGIGSTFESGAEGAIGSYGIANMIDGGGEPDQDLPVRMIDLGAGDDFVFARGATNGVFNVALQGDTGNDVFDLQSGTGFVFGGADTDTLILEGAATDYDFFYQAGSQDADVDDGVVIINEGNGTELLVFEVEFFQFGGEIIAYGDLEFQVV